MRSSKPGGILLALALVASACVNSTGATSSTAEPADSSTTIVGDTVTSVAPPLPTPTFEEGACEFEVPEGRTVECGWVEVSQDRSDPDAGNVRLHVAIFRSESPNPAPDPVIYLEGGPGGEALEAIPLVFEDRFAHLLADRDLIMFDQRGTSYSIPSLACPELRELTFELIELETPDEERASMEAEALQACRDRVQSEGADLASYSSAASAADLAELRMALGIDEWNVYGISYGTRLALTLVRDHPEGIRSVVLDSAYPPEVDLYAAAPPNLDRSLQVLFASCATDEACSSAYPALETKFYETMIQLEQAPIRAPVTDIFTGTTYDAVIDGSTLVGVVFQGLYSAEVIPALPQLIYDTAAGETYWISLLLSSFLANGEFISVGMQTSVQCREEVSFSSPEALASSRQAHPELEPFFEVAGNLNETLFETCSYWGAGEADPIENEPVSAALPALVLAGDFDPITPPSWGKAVTDSLENVTYVEFPGIGHGSTASAECPKEILREFLTDPTGEVDLSCTTLMGPPLFLTPDAPIPPVELVSFTETFGGTSITGVVPDNWESQGPGVWARQLNSLDQTAIIQQLAPSTNSATLLGLIGPQFGLGPDSEAVSGYSSPVGEWSIYEGATAGVPATIALADTPQGGLLVMLLSAPNDQQQLLDEVFFPALDAITVG